MENDSNFGQVKLGYLAHSWFGRPLLLADQVDDSARGLSLQEAIDARLEGGCDGFTIRQPSANATEEKIAQFEKAVRDYADKAFVYIILERPELGFLRSMSFPKGHMIASRSPKTLASLWRAHPLSNIALMVESELGFEGLRRCPYSCVTIDDAVVSHARVLEIRPGKEVFVRLIFGERGVSDEKQFEKRLRWSIHEQADAIITNRTEPAARVLGLTR